MLNIVHTDPSPALAAKQITGWRLTWSRLSFWWQRQLYRMPRLVRIGDEIDVVLRFTEVSLETGPDSDLAEIEKRLMTMGVTFDKGTGQGSRDWEMDFSLSGPLLIQFRGKAERPQNRVAKAKPSRPHLVA